MSTAATMAPEAPQPDQKPLGQAERLANVFAAPSKTFSDIRRNASWWAPWLILALCSYALVFTVDKKVGWDTVTQNQIRMNPKAADRMDQLKASNPDQYQKNIELQTKITKGISMVYPFVGLIAAVVIAAVLMAVFNFGLGAEITFKQSLAVFYHASLIGAIKAILAVVTLFAGSNVENFNFSNPVGTNLAYYLDQANTSRALFAFAGWLDVLSIWLFAVMGLGYAIVAGKKKSTGIGIMLGIYGFFALVATAWAAI